MQPGGAKRRSVVHNVVLNPQGGAQHRSHKPRQTDRHTDRQAHRQTGTQTDGTLENIYRRYGFITY